MSAGIGYAAFDTFGAWVLNFKFPALIRGWDPRLWSPFISLREILANKFHQDYWNIRAPRIDDRRVSGGYPYILFTKLIYNRLNRTKRLTGYSFGVFLLPVLLGLGSVVSPLLTGIYRDKGICQADTLKIYEEIGHTIQETIPENSQVYWAANTVMPLLYTSTLHIYYPQIYSIPYFRFGGDTLQLLKHGFWNDELAKQWQSEASFLVATSNWADRVDFPGKLFLSNYTVTRTIISNPCDPSSFFLIYQKKP